MQAYMRVKYLSDGAEMTNTSQIPLSDPAEMTRKTVNK